MEKYLFLACALFLLNTTTLSGQWTNPKESVGIQHNALVKSVFPSSINSTKSSSEARYLVRDELLKSNNSLFWIAERSWTDPVLEANYLAQNGHISSSVLSLVLDDLNHILKGSLNASGVSEYADNRGQSAKSLNKQDADAYHSFLAGLSYSAKLWLTEGLGGEHISKGFSPAWSGNDGVQERRFNPWKALGCDAVGCLLGPQAGGVATLCSVINQWE